jgi:hypothetical protein
LNIPEISELSTRSRAVCGPTHTRYCFRNPVRGGRDTSPPSLSSLVLSPILPSFLPTYLLTFRPTQFCDLPPYFLRLRHSPPPRVPLFFPRSPSPSMSVVPARPFFYFIFSQIVPPRSVARQDLHIAENLTVFLLFYPFFISGSVSRFSNLSRCPPSSSNQSLCQWAVIPSVRFLQVSEVSGS